MRGPCSTLNEATDGIGGTYPQHQEMSRGYDYDAPNSVHHLLDDALPDFEPDFDTVVVHGHARMTDLISSAPIMDTGYLVGPRLRAVLERHALPRHRFYSVPMTYRGKPVAGYSWLQLTGPRVFVAEDATPAAAEAALSAVPDLAAVDLLRLYQPQRFAYCYVSAPLRRAMEAARITGVRFGNSRLFRSAAPPPTAVHPDRRGS